MQTPPYLAYKIHCANVEAVAAKPPKSCRRVVVDYLDCGARHLLGNAAVDKAHLKLLPVDGPKKQRGRELVSRALIESCAKSTKAPSSWVKVAKFCENDKRLLRRLLDVPEHGGRTALRWLIDARDGASLHALLPSLPPGNFDQQRISVGKNSLGELGGRGWGVTNCENGQWFAGEIAWFVPAGEGCLMSARARSIPVHCQLRADLQIECQRLRE